MPTTTRETVLSRYRYDPLDRLSTQTDIQRFYCNNRLATEVGGGVQTSLFQHDDQLLAQRQVRADKIDTTLLATDQQRSVLNALDATRPHPIAYSPYGHRPPENGLLSLLGFNGERPDPVTGHYHLGNGYRQFNPVLMRFNSPDSWSPFGKGGLNAYAYCAGEPISSVDPSGHEIVKIISGLIARGKGSGPHPYTKIALKEAKKSLGGEKTINKIAKQKGENPVSIVIQKAEKTALTDINKNINIHSDTSPSPSFNSYDQSYDHFNAETSLKSNRDFFDDLSHLVEIGPQKRDTYISRVRILNNQIETHGAPPNYRDVLTQEHNRVRSAGNGLPPTYDELFPFR
ncbi:RHS repeat-associated core domain-containing protein [Pseudomonas sp. Sample_16]|uniref:RHS repeat-associated core domain-containing protein n=1 Tax=Pseudomonas sp. Sample_16 TaxID=2448263 RepID=UPI001032B532|nr:RHS repeat-associated core domain-containing protein [Pseudomonas sp. Sample_16]